jgi:hypothetical protein
MDGNAHQTSDFKIIRKLQKQDESFIENSVKLKPDLDPAFATQNHFCKIICHEFFKKHHVLLQKADETSKFLRDLLCFFPLSI